MQPEDLRAARERLGMSQSEFARNLGMTQTYVSMMERGVNKIRPRTELAVRSLMQQAASEQDLGSTTGSALSDAEREALGGDFSEIGRVHDWRNYISVEVRGLWHTFTPLQKLALYRQADEQAQAEHWD